MNTRQLQLVIRAHSQTASAFTDVRRQFASVQHQIAWFNRRNITIPRVFNAIFVAIGSGVQHTLSVTGRGFDAIGLLMENRARDLFRRARNLRQQAALARISGNTARATSLRNQAITAQIGGEQAEGRGAIFASIGGALEGAGRAIAPIIGIIGAVGSVTLQLFFKLLEVIINIGKAIWEHFIHSLQVVGQVAGEVLQVVIGFGTAFAKAGLDFNSFKEQTLISFGVLFKSTDVAIQKFQFLKHFADITPFDTKETIDAGKQLASYGLEIERYIRVAGNLAAAFNKPLEQAVTLLGRAKAGIFATRQFAPFGISRDRLQSIGLAFKPSGAPTDRSQLLPAVEAVVNRDFGGMIERQSRSSKGLLSTLGAFFTEEFPGLVTQGLERSRKAILLFVLDFVNLIRSNGQLKRVSEALGQVFDTIGAVAFQAVKLLPSIVSAFDAMVQSGKWQHFLEIIWTVFSQIFSLMVQALKWVADNWDTIWDHIVTIGVGAVKIIGGSIAGLLNIYQEWVDSGGNLQTLFHDMGNAIKGFAVIAVHSLTQVIAMMFVLQGIIGLIEIGFGYLAKAPPMIAKGLVDLTVGLAGALSAAGLGAMIEKNIRGFNVDDLFKDHTKDLAARKDMIGSFFRGYNNFDSGVDSYLKNFKPQGLPKLPSFNDTFQFPGTGAGGDQDLFDRMKEASDEQLKMLEHQVQAWQAIVEASKVYAEVLADPTERMTVQLQAQMGLLNALQTQKGAMMANLQLQEAGTAEWWKAVQNLNKNIEAINKIRDEVRKLLFDTEQLSAAMDFGDKLFQLAKDAGFGTQDLANIATEQQQMLTQSLLVERARLATLTRGTTEWYKQRGTIVDIISKMVHLKKELQEANVKIAGPMLMQPKTPFGMRGPAFGSEWVNDTSLGTQYGKDIKNLLLDALNPKPFNIDIWSKQFMPAGAQTGFNISSDTFSAAKTFADANATALAPHFQSIGDAITGRAGRSYTPPNDGPASTMFYGPAGAPSSSSIGSDWTSRTAASKFGTEIEEFVQPVQVASSALGDLNRAIQQAIGNTSFSGVNTDDLNKLFPGRPHMSQREIQRYRSLPPPVRSAPYGMFPVTPQGIHSDPSLQGFNFAGARGMMMPLPPLQPGGHPATPATTGRFWGNKVGPPMPSDYYNLSPRHGFPWNDSETPEWSPDSTVTPSAPAFGSMYNFWKSSNDYNDELLRVTPGLRNPMLGNMGSSSGGPWSGMYPGINIGDININGAVDVEKIKREALAAFEAKLDAAIDKLRQGQANRGGD